VIAGKGYRNRQIDVPCAGLIRHKQPTGSEVHMSNQDMFEKSLKITTNLAKQINIQMSFDQGMEMVEAIKKELIHIRDEEREQIRLNRSSIIKEVLEKTGQYLSDAGLSEKVADQIIDRLRTDFRSPKQS
jgi:hypothetical protein